MSRLIQSDWLVPLLLILLTAEPVAAAVYRAAMLLSGGPVLPETARFFAFPFSVLVHLLSSSVFCVLGALQFSAVLWERGWHAVSGRLVWLTGLVAAASGLWLTWVFPQGEYDGPWLFAIRLAVANGMLLCLLWGLRAVLRRDFERHRGWMIRAYALGIGAGTQAFTHLPFLFLSELKTELLRTLCMAAGWVINLAVAEWIVRSRPARRRAMASRAFS